MEHIHCWRRCRGCNNIVITQLFIITSSFQLHEISYALYHITFSLQELHFFFYQNVLVLISMQRTPTESGVSMNTMQVINKSKAFTSMLITYSINFKN